MRITNLAQALSQELLYAQTPGTGERAFDLVTYGSVSYGVNMTLMLEDVAWSLDGKSSSMSTTFWLIAQSYPFV